MRISELTQRTNRCTNGVRYSVGELDRLQNNPEYHLFSVYVSDRYGDLGLVGAMGQYERTGECKLDLFCLSCRALGRNVEKVMLSYLKRNVRMSKIFILDLLDITAIGLSLLSKALN